MILIWLLSAFSLAGILQVDILDIGQGDAILIRSPAGKTVLIDGGTGKKGDIVAMLRSRNVQEINLMVATHPHADHIGGLDEVLEAFKVNNFLDSGQTHTTRTYSKVMELVEKKEISYLQAKNGRVLRLDDGIELEVIHPQDALLRNTRSDLNSNSVVIRMTHNKNCFLFTGDAEEPTEDLLVQKGIKPCNVLKVAHHGSNHSSTQHFLEAVQPKIALISLGENNRYGHPGAKSVARLQAVGAEIYRTDLQGTLHVESDGETVTVTTEKGAQQSTQKTVDSTPPDHHPPPVPKTDHNSVDSAGKFDINTATLDQLDSIKGIGPKKAADILAYIEAHKPIKNIDDLRNVKGVGAKTLENIKQSAYVAP